MSSSDQPTGRLYVCPQCGYPGWERRKRCNFCGLKRTWWTSFLSRIRTALQQGTRDPNPRAEEEPPAKRPAREKAPSSSSSEREQTAPAAEAKPDTETKPKPKKQSASEEKPAPAKKPAPKTKEKTKTVSASKEPTKEPTPRDSRKIAAAGGVLAVTGLVYWFVLLPALSSRSDSDEPKIREISPEAITSTGMESTQTIRSQQDANRQDPRSGDLQVNTVGVSNVKQPDVSPGQLEPPPVPEPAFGGPLITSNDPTTPNLPSVPLPEELDLPDQKTEVAVVDDDQQQPADNAETAVNQGAEVAVNVGASPPDTVDPTTQPSNVQTPLVTEPQRLKISRAFRGRRLIYDYSKP